jgi:nitrite reductase/ring-hydroxylating ferredoxin subunit
VSDIRVDGVAVLAQVGGSVKYQFHDFIKPLIINRVSSTRLVALDSTCTHQGCSVGKFVVQDQRMRCPCHGSRYDIEGRVFRDAEGNSTEPASDDLARFVTSYDAASDVVSVVLPDIQLSVRSISVHQRSAGGAMRLKLVFPATAFATYEVQYAASPAGPFTRVPFALSASAASNLQTHMPEDDGDLAVYVDATGQRGFFAVGLVLTRL